ncbi:MAG: hypothetical protein JWR37_5071 [Mycobacterium sp.]|jgi:hypothetical protein|nr:hypothetical protein [Mycobacterium sp.]
MTTIELPGTCYDEAPIREGRAAVMEYLRLRSPTD